MPWAIFCVPQAIPEQFSWCVRARCPAEKATAIRKCLLELSQMIIFQTIKLAIIFLVWFVLTPAMLRSV